MATPGPRQHYLPASFVARFSADANPDVRRRRVFAARRHGHAPFVLAAENAAFVRNLYTERIDAIWTAYEARLPAALDALCDSSHELDAETWLRVLVPFVAALLLRGPDFDERFRRRLEELIPGGSERYVPDTRAFELQRLLAPVAASRWVVMHAIGQKPVITSDVGWAPYRDNLAGELGFAIPLDVNTVLGLVPIRTRGALYWNGNKWSAVIDHRNLRPENHAGLHQVLASFAYLQVFGPTRESVADLQEVLDKPPLGPADPFPFGPLSGVNGPPNEFTWHRLVSALQKQPADPTLADFPLDLAALKGGWTPVLVFPANLPEFPPALRLKGNLIEIALFAVLEAKPSGWKLAQDMPLSYPPAPQGSAYAVYQSELEKRSTERKQTRRVAALEFAPGVRERAVAELRRRRLSKS